MKLPNYLSKIERLVKKGKLTKGALTHVDIAHDDWCAFSPMAAHATATPRYGCDRTSNHYHDDEHHRH